MPKVVLNLYRFLLIYIILIISTTTKPFYPPEIILPHNFMQVKPFSNRKMKKVCGQLRPDRCERVCRPPSQYWPPFLQHLAADQAGGICQGCGRFAGEKIKNFCPRKKFSFWEFSENLEMKNSTSKKSTSLFLRLLRKTAL